MKRYTKYITTGFILLTIVVSFYSCSTKKNTFTRRFYHNMTARYNGYFNGNESFKEGLAELEKLHVDDYAKILSIYKLGTAENAASLNTYFDKAYTKASTVIQKHSIFIKKKEHVRWVPEAYLLIGKAYYYKQEYKLAADAFEYIIKQYDNYPIKYDAMLWLCRTYNQQKKYTKTEALLEVLQNKIDRNKVGKSALKEFPLVYSDFHLKQQNYDPAIEYLLSGINKNRKKQIRLRLRFILAQIYQHNGNFAYATALYDKVIKMNPPYEMAFNAKINKAMCYDVASGNSKNIKKLLNRMAKDSKNVDYLDQIYYALAEICMKESDTTCAISNYKLSSEKSILNKNQKATSLLKLANLYFSMPEYELAEAYYDSTMLVLPKDYPNYNKISALTKVLKNLVTNLRIVQLQDSLQQLSKLTDAERNKIVDAIITKVIKEEQQKKLDDYQKQQNIYNAATASALTTTTASWYFYNPTAINFGKAEFVKKWGSRKLEDLWWLAKKQAEESFENVENSNDSISTDSVKTKTISTFNLKDRNYYIKNIPFSKEDIKKSNGKIIEALYNIGLVYQNDLSDLPKAIEYYEEIIKRFPADSDYVIKSYYQLYLAYDDMDNASKRNYYKELICSKYPSGDYCNIIKDPNYKKISDQNVSLANKLYKETFNAYKENKWDSVIVKSKRATELFDSDTLLMPKFNYLKAVSYGKLKDSLNFVNTLKYIITKYPTNALMQKAQDLLDFYTGKIKTTTKVNGKTSAKKEYKFDENSVHLYAIVVKVSKDFKISDLKNSISNFNTKNYNSNKLSVSNIFLNDTLQIVTVNNFENKEKAMLYYKNIKSDKDVFIKIKVSDYTQFVISVDNYPDMYKNKDVENYKIFFAKNYLK
ncbi:MAG: tetratricopeptide repeat protein [Bacteroidetes bacterium]|nr:tetratricopeptide repeat protein [Bacteroidota bacterium]